MKQLFSLALLCLLVISCSKEETSTPNKKVEFNFVTDDNTWQVAFADYPKGEEDFYELKHGTSNLPQPLDETKKALMISGNNHSDDLFMYIKKKVDGLEANTTYTVSLDLQIATDASKNSVGVGGSPGSSVYVKAGVTSTEPKGVLDEPSGHYRMNIDKGNQGQEGADMKIIGNLSNEKEEYVYVLKDYKLDKKVEAKANENGELWLIVGTDSGFEGITTIYYNSISLALTKK